MKHVLRSRHDFEIDQAVVCFDAVPMIDFKAVRDHSFERLPNQSMGERIGPLAFFTQMKGDVAAIFDAFGDRLPSRFPTKGCATKAIPCVGNLVAVLKSEDGLKDQRNLH